MGNLETSSARARTTWSTFTTDAPDLARRVGERFATHLHHVIGTVRPNGAPRLSGTEVHITESGVTIGMMPDSRKLADVRRDPRVELHSAPLEEDLANGDAKLAGQLIEIRNTAPEHPGAGFFELDLRLVSLVRVEDDELVFTTWRSGRGVQELRRR